MLDVQILPILGCQSHLAWSTTMHGMKYKPELNEKRRYVTRMHCVKTRLMPWNRSPQGEPCTHCVTCTGETSSRHSFQLGRRFTEMIPNSYPLVHHSQPLLYCRKHFRMSPALSRYQWRKTCSKASTPSTLQVLLLDGLDALLHEKSLDSPSQKVHWL